ncbi:MAG: XdhC family protein [Carboxydocellales bacterium]
MAEAEGMVCGGTMSVYIDILNNGIGGDKQLLLAYLHSITAGEEPILITVTKSAYTDKFPPGGKLVLTSGGKLIGTLGDEQTNQAALQLAEQVRLEGKTLLLDLPSGDVQLFLEPAPTPVDLLILGGGHIALPLATMANLLGYQVTVVDDRPAFANRSRFPNAKEVICNDFGCAVQQLAVSPKTFVVIVTRGHRHDKVCLQGLITRPSAYIGMIGSRRRVKALIKELAAEGIASEYLQKLHSPIGLDIAAETPEEIAVGILAELIKVHRGGHAQSLSLQKVGADN